MEILGIGMPELIFVIIISLIVLGPKDMQKAGSTIGKWLRSIVTSDGWKIFQQTSREIRTLPNKLIRDANEELNQINKEIKSASPLSGKTPQPAKPLPRSQPYSAKPTPSQSPAENTINPEAKETESDPTSNA
jgi:Sec-independent protein translocase protein TatA